MTHSQLLISCIITLLTRRPKCYFYFSTVSYFALSTSHTSQDQAQLQNIDHRLLVVYYHRALHTGIGFQVSAPRFGIIYCPSPPSHHYGYNTTLGS